MALYDWTVRYEADALPQDASPAWLASVGGTASVASSELTSTTVVTEVSGALTNQWTRPSLTAGPYTVETSMKLTAYEEFAKAGFQVQNGSYLGGLRIYKTGDGVSGAFSLHLIDGAMIFAVGTDQETKLAGVTQVLSSYTRLRYTLAENGLSALYINDVLTITGTVTTTSASKQIVFGHGCQFVGTTTAVWDYVEYKLDGAVDPVDLPPSFTVTVTSPAHEGTIRRGRPITVTWTAAGGVAPVTVDVTASYDAGATFPDTIADDSSALSGAWRPTFRAGALRGRVKAVGTDGNAATASDTNSVSILGGMGAIGARRPISQSIGDDTGIGGM